MPLTLKAADECQLDVLTQDDSRVAFFRNLSRSVIS